MSTKFKRSNCAICGQPVESDVLEDGTRNCRACAGAARRRAGTVLRHWTTNVLAFKGKSIASQSEAADWGLADGRRRNLIASKLKTLAGAVGAL